MVVKVKEKLAVTKQETQKFDVERFNLRKLNELKARKQYQLKISKSLQLWRTQMIART